MQEGWLEGFQDWLAGGGQPQLITLKGRNHLISDIVRELGDRGYIMLNTKDPNFPIMLQKLAVQYLPDYQPHKSWKQVRGV